MGIICLWVSTLGDFRIYIWKEKQQKNCTDFSPLPHYSTIFFIFQFLPFPAPTLFFNLFRSAGFEKAAALLKQLCHPHQGTCESQLHSIISRSIWFSSACLPTCCPGSVIYWVGLRPWPAEPSCVQPTLFWSTWGRVRQATEQAEPRALQLLLMKWWQIAGDVVGHRRITFPQEFLSFKELPEHRFCRRKQKMCPLMLMQLSCAFHVS